MEDRLSPPPATLPAEVEAQVVMDFPDAIREVIKGNAITRLSWDPKEDSYGILVDEYLSIHIHGAFKVWMINDGDLEGTDWVVR